MSAGIEYYIVKSYAPKQLLICSCEWYKDTSALASGEDDYVIYYLDGVIEESKLEEFKNSDKGNKWKNCEAITSHSIIDELYLAGELGVAE